MYQTLIQLIPKPIEKLRKNIIKSRINILISTQNSSKKSWEEVSMFIARKSKDYDEINMKQGGVRTEIVA